MRLSWIKGIILAVIGVLATIALSVEGSTIISFGDTYYILDWSAIAILTIFLIVAVVLTIAVVKLVRRRALY